MERLTRNQAAALRRQHEKTLMLLSAVTKFRLGGWWRLYIIFLVVSAVGIGGPAYLSMPRLQDMPHSAVLASVYSRESAKQQIGKLKRPEALQPWEAAFWIDEPLSRRTTNGMVLWFPPHSRESHMRMVVETYELELKEQWSTQKREIVTKALLLWLGLCGALLAVGLTISWVRRGFRST
jgi:hypothetical protein